MFFLNISVTTLEDNSELRDKLADMMLPVQEYMQIPIDEEKTDCRSNHSSCMC